MAPFCKNRWDLTLLLAVTMDGNDEILPLAWAIVPTESLEEWIFFLDHFKAAFSAVNDPSMVIISDRGKGLESAVPTCLPLAVYYHCAQHICNNLMEKFHPGNEVKKLFWKGVFAPSSSLYETCLQQINTINEAARHYLYGIPAKIWA
jgi:zinc finger SWIM domain-containing protein 3